MSINIEINFDRFQSLLFNSIDQATGMLTADAFNAREAVKKAAKRWASYLTNEEFSDITAKASQSDSTNRTFLVADPTKDNSNTTTIAGIPVQLSNDIDDIIIYVGTAPTQRDTQFGSTFVVSAQDNLFPPSIQSRLNGKQTVQPFLATISFKDLSQAQQKWWTDSSKTVDTSMQVPITIIDSQGSFSVNANKYVDLYTIALHEIGHTLGYNDYRAYLERSQNGFFTLNGGTNIPLASALPNDRGRFHAASTNGQTSSDLMSEDDAIFDVISGKRTLDPSPNNLKVLASLGFNVNNSGIPVYQANGTADPDIFSATSNNDNLDGLGGDDLINGADGLDSIRGGLGNDTLLGGSGNDNLSGDDGSDSLFGDIEVLGFSSLSGNDTINGGKGNDSLYGGYGDDSLVGGDDDDYLDGGPGKDTIDGGKGNDTVKIDSSDPVVVNVENRQAAAGSDGDDNLYGSKGNDIMRGGNDADRLEGLEGNDTLYGGGTQGETTAGKDTLYGGDGSDLLVSNVPFAVTQKDLPSSTYTSGEDTLDGGIGNDTLLGGTNTADKTTMYGGDGNDTIVAQSGQAFMHGGIGNDSIRGGSNTTFNGNTASGDDGNDTIEAGSGGMAGAGGAGDDVLKGSTGVDYFWGGLDNDKLFAKGNYDTLEGNSGNDTLQADGSYTLLLGADFRAANSGLNEVDVLISSPTGPTIFALGYDITPGQNNVFWMGDGNAQILGFKSGDYFQTVDLGSNYSATKVGTNINIAYNGDLIAIVENYSNLSEINRLLRIPQS